MALYQTDSCFLIKEVETWQTPKTQLARMLSQQNRAKRMQPDIIVFLSRNKPVLWKKGGKCNKQNWSWNILTAMKSQDIYKFWLVGTRISCSTLICIATWFHNYSEVWLSTHQPSKNRWLTDEYLPWPSPVISLKVKPRTALWNWWWTHDVCGKVFWPVLKCEAFLGQVLLDVCMVFVCLLGLNSWVNR